MTWTVFFIALGAVYLVGVAVFAWCACDLAKNADKLMGLE